MANGEAGIYRLNKTKPKPEQQPWVGHLWDILGYNVYLLLGGVCWKGGSRTCARWQQGRSLGEHDGGLFYIL